MTQRIKLLGLLTLMYVGALAQTSDAFTAGGNTQNNVYVAIGQPFYRQIAGSDHEIAYSVAQAQLFGESRTEEVCQQINIGDCTYSPQLDYEPGTYQIDDYYEVNGHDLNYDVMANLTLTVYPVYSQIQVQYVYKSEDQTLPDKEWKNYTTIHGCDSIVHVVYAYCPYNVQDAEGNSYSTVIVGNRCWTRENLKLENSGNSKVYKSDTYSNEDENESVFGRLYTWESIASNGSLNTVVDQDAFEIENVLNSIPDNCNPDETNKTACMGVFSGICPEGWHIPTQSDINSLKEYNVEDLRSTQYWIAPNANTNSTEFTEFPAGRYNGETERFEGLMSSSYMHYMSDRICFSDAPLQPQIATFQYYCNEIQCSDNNKAEDAYSVRCVKDLLKDYFKEQ